MNFKKILTAAAAAAVLSVAGVTMASAHPMGGGFGYHERFHDGWRDRRMVDHRVIFDTLRFHGVRYVGDPFFISGHYVVRSFDRFGRVRFVEVDPYSGMLIGYFRL